MAIPRRKKRAATTPTPPAFWVIPSIVITMAVCGVLVYARSSAAFVLTRLLTDGLLSFIWVLAAGGIGAAALRRILCNTAAPAVTSTGATPVLQRPGATLFCITAIGLGIGLISLITLGLGLAGWLNRVTALILLLVGFCCALLEIRRLIGAGLSRSERAGASTGRWIWLATTPFLAIALIGTMTPPGLLWTPDEPHGFDVLEYHLEGPREWFDAGRIVPLPHNVFTYLPMGAEMHYLLAMHLEGGPWDGMYLAQLMHLWMIVLTVLATAAIARSIAPTPISATIAAVALATIPWLAQLGAIAYNDGALLLLGTLAIGWAMRGLVENQTRHFLIAGLLAGFACGVKLTAVPELLVAIPGCAVSLGILRRVGVLAHRFSANLRPDGGRVRPPCKTFPGSPRTVSSNDEQSVHGANPAPIANGRLAKGLVLFAIAGVLVFLPWLARDFAWTGNPVFPEAASVIGKAHWTDAQVVRWHRANHEPGGGGRTPSTMAQALWRQILGSWQFGYVLVPLSVVAIAILIVRKRRQSASNAPELAKTPPDRLPFTEDSAFSEQQTRTRALFLVPLLLFLLIFWVGFTHLQSRFFLMAAPVGALLIAQVDWCRSRCFVIAIVIGSATCGFVRLNRKLTTIIWQRTPDGAVSATDTLARTTLQWLTPVGVEDADAPGKQLILIGDSRPFIYQMPMSRLRYRTIFDLDTSELGAAPNESAIINAWAGRSLDAARPPGEYLLIDGSELERFHKTYFDVPSAPRWPQAPIVIPPAASVSVLDSTPTSDRPRSAASR